jgi:hypothetical protein
MKKGQKLKQDKKTVGQHSVELNSKKPDSANVIDLQRSMQSEYTKYFLETLYEGKKQYQDDFYIVVITRRDRLMDNVVRNQFLHRKSCPTPDYDQVAYKYNKKDDNITFLWVLPDKTTAQLLKENALLVAGEEKELLRYVLEDSAGDLLIKSKKLNGEI